MQAFHPRVFERVCGLFTQCLAIDQKKDTAEAFGFKESVDQSDAGLRFPRSRCHGEQELSLAAFDRRLGFKDRFFLIMAQLEAVVKRFRFELGVRGDDVLLQESCQSFW